MLFGQEHVTRYRDTGGEEGHDWQGTHTLILTTTGRRSGEQRSTPLIYGRSGEDYLVVASKGGADEPPAWYLNLEASPEADSRSGPIASRCEAAPLRLRRKPDMWETMTAQWPAYDDYQQKTKREIPVVVLERA